MGMYPGEKSDGFRHQVPSSGLTVEYLFSRKTMHLGNSVLAQLMYYKSDIIRRN
jgi:hypothetical protein